MINSHAIFSDDRRYRYVLWRIWDEKKPMIMFIGLNPSTADELNDDPTMRRCMGFAKLWGCGGYYMTNLFAFRATFPSDLKKAVNPIGPENDRWIKKIESKVEKVVFAWGINGTYMNRDKEMVNLIEKGYCIGLTKDGHPKHPLYLRSDLLLMNFKSNI